MKGTFYEYDDEGKVIKKSKVNYIITWGDEKPVISITLPDKSKTRHLAVDIPLQQFLYLFNKQVDSKRIERLRK